MEFRCKRNNRHFENPAYLELVFETWRKEIFDAEVETRTSDRNSGTRSANSIRRRFGAFIRTLTFARMDREMRREIWNQSLMYVIVTLVVFLVVPLFRYAV